MPSNARTIMKTCIATRPSLDILFTFRPSSLGWVLRRQNFLSALVLPELPNRQRVNNEPTISLLHLRRNRRLSRASGIVVSEGQPLAACPRLPLLHRRYWTAMISTRTNNNVDLPLPQLAAVHIRRNWREDR